MGLAMRDPYSPSPAVVVGIDGSRSAMQAALWAIEEAVDRDVALQLVYAIHSSESDPSDRTAELATAERVVHQAFTAIESTGKPVKMQADIVHCAPITALTEASRSAAMLCLGSTGLEHALKGRTGSTASALAACAHCPVAIVPTSAGPASDGWVLAVVDGSPYGSAVLELAVSEARLRDAPLRVLNTMPTRCKEVAQTGRAADGNGVAAQLDRRLMAWRRKHPDVDIESTTIHGNVVNYLEYLRRNAQPVQLLVVEPRRADILLGPAGRAALDAAQCSLLISDRQCWL
jgi:nucleotide-binding universal stress UspA family protein